MKKLYIQFKRKNTYPVPITVDTDDKKIEVREVSEDETYVINGLRYYDMVIGHGHIQTLPVYRRKK